jgi:hypothetical protein
MIHTGYLLFTIGAEGPFGAKIRRGDHWFCLVPA